MFPCGLLVFEIGRCYLPVRTYIHLHRHGYRGCDGNNVNNNNNMMTISLPFNSNNNYNNAGIINNDPYNSNNTNNNNNSNNAIPLSSFGDNLFVNAQKDLLYSVSSVGVVYNAEKNTQRLFNQTSETIMRYLL